ncbi:MAG: class I SAM-dependent methyltransferase [Gemmatimonadota bacterium]
MGPSLLSPSWLVHHLHGRAVAAALAAQAGGRLLDVGCGGDPFRDLLAAHSTRALGLEPDRSRYAGRARPAVWGSGLDLPFGSAAFDTVVSFQVLEHVPEPARMMAEMARVLRPGGRLIVSAPHMWGVHEEPHDYFRFTGFGLAHLARAAGLEVREVRALAGYWVTAGARFCYYLQHFDRWGLALLVRPTYAVVQLASLALDRLHRVEGDAWNFLLVAARPEEATA